MTVTEQSAVGELAELLFKTPGPVLAVAKIAITDDPWALPEKDGAAIGQRFREALGVRRPEARRLSQSSGSNAARSCA